VLFLDLALDRKRNHELIEDTFKVIVVRLDLFDGIRFELGARNHPFRKASQSTWKTTTPSFSLASNQHIKIDSKLASVMR
jgi:hypothetical protein